MWIEIDNVLVNFNTVEWVRPHDDYPKTRVYVMHTGREQSDVYHISFKALQKSIRMKMNPSPTVKLTDLLQK